MEATTEWKMGGGGGVEGHTLQSHSLGAGDKCPHPKFPSFVLDWEGAQKCFILYSTTRLQEISNPIVYKPASHS